MDMSVSASAGTAAAQPLVSAQASSGSATATAAPVTKVAASEHAAKAKPERAELEKAVKSIQDFSDSTQRNLKFSIDEKSHQVVVKVIATQTGMVVRQIPDEAAVKLAHNLSETGSLILDEQA